MENSTMCAFNDHPDVNIFGITSEDKEFIVNEHNKHRSAEKAQDMLKLVSGCEEPQFINHYHCNNPICGKSL